MLNIAERAHPGLGEKASGKRLQFALENHNF